MLKRVRFFYQYLLAIFRKQWRRFGTLIVIFSVILLLVSVLTPSVTESFTSFATKTIKPIYREGVVGKAETFNPLFSRMESEKEINSLVFRGLTKVSPEGKVEPDLAESIEIKNNLEYFFKLRKDVSWHDGQKFTADDVIHTISLAQNRLYDSEVSENFRDVDVSKVDNYTVSFKLKEPFAPFLTSTTLGIIPAHVSLTDYRPIGTGKFRFINVSGDSVTLENSQIRLRFQYYPTESDAILALKLGQIHSISLGPSGPGKLSDWNNFHVKKQALPYRLVTLFYNTREHNFKEKNIRQALTFALDKNQIVSGTDGPKGKIASNSYPFLPSLQASTKEKYSLNLEKSKQLLETEGWKKVDGVLLKDGQKFSLTITTLADTEFEDAATKIKKNWETLGIEVTITAVSGTELRDQIVPNRSYNVLLSSLQLDSDPDQYVIWHTTQGESGNVSGISSPKLDKLLEDARKTLDAKVRSEKYVEFSKHLLDESPAAFLYYPNYIWVYSARLQNLDLDNLRQPEDRFEDTENWNLKHPLI